MAASRAASRAASLVPAQAGRRAAQVLAWAASEAGTALPHDFTAAARLASAAAGQGPISAQRQAVCAHLHA